MQHAVGKFNVSSVPTAQTCVGEGVLNKRGNAGAAAADRPKQEFCKHQLQFQSASFKGWLNFWLIGREVSTGTGHRSRRLAKPDTGQ